MHKYKMVKHHGYVWFEITHKQRFDNIGLWIALQEFRYWCETTGETTQFKVTYRNLKATQELLDLWL